MTVEKVAQVLCNSGKFETGQGGCALICMGMLGRSRPNCAHAVEVHGELAQTIIDCIPYDKTAIAQLRHAYSHMANGRVRDIQALARNLIGPAIEKLERAQ